MAIPLKPRRRLANLTEFFHSPRAFPAAGVFLGGLGFLALSCLCTSNASPTGLIVSGWTEGFSFPLVGISLLICASAPFFSPCRFKDRLRLVGIGMGIFVVWFAICAVIYTSAICGAHAKSREGTYKAK